MIDYIYILDIVEDTTVDGPGLRTSVYSAELLRIIVRVVIILSHGIFVTEKKCR